VNSSVLRNLSRNRPLSDSAKTFCYGDPGSIYAVLMVSLASHQSGRAWAMNSVRWVPFAGQLWPRFEVNEGSVVLGLADFYQHLKLDLTWARQMICLAVVSHHVDQQSCSLSRC
jgi:hypothetical protein